MPQSLFNLKRLRILTVGGSPSVRATVVAYMGRWKIRHDEVETPDQARSALRRAVAEGEPFTVAFLDLGLPDDAGLSLARELKSDPELGRTALVALPRWPGDRELHRTRPSGIAAVLREGFDGSDLFDTILQVTAETGPRRSRPPRSESPPADHDVGHTDRTRLLLVDDNELNRLLAAEVLKAAGYPCDFATSGEDAVDAATRRHYDLIFMDCQMPGMDGFEATRRICEIERERGDSRAPHGKAVIVALTSESELSCRDRGRSVGMDDFLGKPFDPHSLIEAVHYYVAGSRDAASTGAAVPVAAAEADGPVPGADSHAAEPGEGAPIDMASLSQTCLGRPSLVRRVLAKFSELLPAMFERLERAIAEKDLEQIIFTAHSIKGSAGNVSAEHLRCAAATMERMARDGSLENLEELIDTIRTELSASLEWAEGFLATEVREQG